MSEHNENGQSEDMKHSEHRANSTGSDPNAQSGGSHQEWQQPREMPVNRDSEFKNLRTLMMIAGIGGPFSFIIGGVALSSVALICAIISMGKFKRLYSGSQSLKDSRRIKRAIIFSIIISSCSLVWNCVWLAMAMPQIMEMITNQDFSSLYSGSESLGNPAPEKSIWD